MARELTIPRLLTTIFGTLAIAVALANPASAAKKAATKRGGGASVVVDDEDTPKASRAPGTLPSGAPSRMPELESLAVSLPFSLRKNLGLTNITEAIQAYEVGAFCKDVESSKKHSNNGVVGTPSPVLGFSFESDCGEAETRSRLPFHVQGVVAEGVEAAAGVDTGAAPALAPAPAFVTLQHVLEATDETFLVYLYDSLDANSYRNAALVDEAAGKLRGYVTTVGVDVRRGDMQWLVGAWNIQLTPAVRLLRPTRMLATTRQGLTTTEAITSTVANTASHLINNLNAALSPSYSLYAGTKAPIDMAPAGNAVALLRQDAWAPEAIRRFALGGGKSLESENSIETLTAGDKAAEIVYDVIRGAHPLTYMSKALLGGGGGGSKPPAKPKDSPSSSSSSSSPDASDSSFDSFIDGALTSPFYNRRAQVPRAVIVLFTDADNALTNLFKAVALRYNNRAVCITVNGKERAPKLAKAFGVTSFPTFAVVKPPQSAYTHDEMRRLLITGEFSKKREKTEANDVFNLIRSLLVLDADNTGAVAGSNLRLFAPAEGSTLSIKDVMAFLDAPSPTNPNPAVSLSGIVAPAVLHSLQRSATRDAYHYQQLRAVGQQTPLAAAAAAASGGGGGGGTTVSTITPISSRKDWEHLVVLHAGLVASGPSVTNPKKAPMVTVGVLFTPTTATSTATDDGTTMGISDAVRQEVGDVKGRLKDNYFVSISKDKAMPTLQYFKEKCVMESERKQQDEEQGGAAEPISPSTLDVVFLYAKLQPLHSSAAGGNVAAAASASFAPNFIIDYSCKTPRSDADSAALLSSAMKIDKAVHYGFKKGFIGFGGSEEPAPSFDWAEVPQPNF